MRSRVPRKAQKQSAQSLAQPRVSLSHGRFFWAASRNHFERLARATQRKYNLDTIAASRFNARGLCLARELCEPRFSTSLLRRLSLLSSHLWTGASRRAVLSREYFANSQEGSQSPENTRGSQSALFSSPFSPRFETLSCPTLASIALHSEPNWVESFETRLWVDGGFDKRGKAELECLVARVSVGFRFLWNLSF